MMPRPRQPVELLLVKGKKHLTKNEVAGRKSSEIRAPSDKVKAPSYLSKDDKKEFNKIAKQLVDIGVMTNLDVDALARFVIARRMYLIVTDELLELSPIVDMEFETPSGRIRTTRVVNENYSDLLVTQDKLFKQCRQAASDLGLTIASRCRLVVPKKEKPKPQTKEEKLFGERL